MIYLFEHSLLEHHLTILKSQPDFSQFRHSWLQISEIVSTLATKDLDLAEIVDDTGKFVGYNLNDTFTIIPIFPCGIQLAKSFVNLIPKVYVGYLAYSNEKDNRIENFCHLPENVSNTKAIICDAIIKTGKTIKNAISRLQIENVTEIKVISIFATTEGIENIRSEFPMVPIYVCSLENSEEIERLSILSTYLSFNNL